jgi:di/tricarboxylate transporter
VDSTGAAAWVATSTLEQLPQGMPPWVLEAAIALLTSLFATMIGNVGSTIVMVPLAINLALAVGGNPTAFALVVALSGSNNVMTVSNPVISMITGPGDYNAKNLWRIGSPLVVAYLVVMLVAVNLMFR